MELDELNVRRDKLTEFVKNQSSTSIDPNELRRLVKQLEYMEKYASILAERIVHFEVT